MNHHRRHDGKVDGLRTRATWAELFYDIVLAFGVSQTTHILAHKPSWETFGEALLVLTPLWWAWVDVALAVNTVEETHVERLLLLAAGLATYGMGVAAPRAMSGHGEAALFALSFLLLRLLMGEATRRERPFARTIHPYSAGLTFALALIGGAFLAPGPRAAVWAAAILAEAVLPALMSSRLHGMTYSAAHLPERFGLFIIIALGENILTVGAGASTGALTGALIAALVLSFVIGGALWWLYFHLAAPAVEHSLRTHHTPATVVRDVLGYGHLVLVTGLLLVAVGTGRTVAHPTDVSHDPTAALLPIGAAIFALTFGYTRWRMFGAASATRIGVGLCLLGLAAGAPFLPAIATLGATALLLVGVNGLEHWLVATGRTVPLVFHRAEPFGARSNQDQIHSANGELT
ncbi:low temperature requirement protein A [Kitasatospora sp. LaBMicrA B282]|uniref:low temperature requirement protein A n=1 Tax=Kitasatospora sp. LaBMicrA B282 TaxID=3420949 RepID=UPI003D114C2F